MPRHTTIQVGDALDTALARRLDQAITALVALLRRKDTLHPIADQLSAFRSSAALVGEFIRQLIHTRVPHRDDFLEQIRWKSGASFDGLAPEFWDVASLIPPRDTAVLHTLRQLNTTHLPATAHILDAGCGTGLLAHLLIDSGFAGEITGFEISPKWIQYANDRPLESFEARNKDITTFDQHYEFDAIWCYMVLHHVSNLDDALIRLYKSLKPHGVFSYTDIVYESTKRGRGVPFPLALPHREEPLASGQILHVAGSTLSRRPHFKPHADGPPPDGPSEYVRIWIEVANALSKAGFVIDKMTVLDEVTVHFSCRRPDTRLWETFANLQDSKVESLKVLEKLEKGGRESHKGAPYQFTLPVLNALWHDLMGEKSIFSGSLPWWNEKKPGKVYVHPGSPDKLADDADVRAVAYFSWEPNSRQFLVRRAWPYSFHLIHYSSVFAHWGALGQMLRDLKMRGERKYMQERGYSFLDTTPATVVLTFMRRHSGRTLHGSSV